MALANVVDTCTFCIKKKLCQPKEPYFGYCQWREEKRPEVPLTPEQKELVQKIVDQLMGRDNRKRY